MFPKIAFVKDRYRPAAGVRSGFFLINWSPALHGGGGRVEQDDDDKEEIVLGSAHKLLGVARVKSPACVAVVSYGASG